jgi:hypothetical protein
MQGKMIPVALLAATLAAGCSAGCSLQKNNSNGNDNVKIETPFGGIKVDTDESAIASSIGLPLYPGATRIKKKTDSGAGDVNVTLGRFQLRFKILSYHTADSPEKVIAFYRKGLASYGDVIECSNDRPVGNPVKTREGLTCDHDGQHHIAVSDVPENADIELKAGGEGHQHVVSIEKQPDGTKFGLVALELPTGVKESN